MANPARGHVRAARGLLAAAAEHPGTGGDPMVRLEILQALHELTPDGRLPDYPEQPTAVDDPAAALRAARGRLRTAVTCEDDVPAVLRLGAAIRAIDTALTRLVAR